MKRKRKTDMRNGITLTISLILVFSINNLMLSVTDFIHDMTCNFINARTIEVNIPRTEAAREILFSFLRDRGSVESVTLSANYLYKPDGIGERLAEDVEGLEKAGVGIYSYKEESIKPYLITKDCKSPEGYEVIIPKYILDGDMDSAAADEKYIDGEEYLGQTIDGDLYRNSSWSRVSFTVIGVYDNVAVGYGKKFLISPDTMAELEGQGYEGLDLESMTASQTMCWYSYEVTVKDAGQLGALEAGLNEIREQFVLPAADGSEVVEFYYYRRVTMNPVFVLICGAILFGGNFIACLLLINTVINMVYTTEHDIRERRKEFGLLKALGYQDEEVKKILLKEKAKLSVIALAVTLALGCVLLIISNIIAHGNLNIYYRSLSFTIHPVIAVFTFGGAIIAPAAGLLVGARQLERLNPIEALHDAEE